MSFVNDLKCLWTWLAYHISIVANNASSSDIIFKTYLHDLMCQETTRAIGEQLWPTGGIFRCILQTSSLSAFSYETYHNIGQVLSPPPKEKEF